MELLLRVQGLNPDLFWALLGTIKVVR